jgi:hypothetical protein
MIWDNNGWLTTDKSMNYESHGLQTGFGIAIRNPIQISSEVECLPRLS